MLSGDDAKRPYRIDAATDDDDNCGNNSRSNSGSRGGTINAHRR